MIIAIVALIWIACIIATTGTLVAYSQGTWPNIADEVYREDVGAGVLLGLCGPFGLVFAMCFSGFWKHGWRLGRLKK